MPVFAQHSAQVRHRYSENFKQCMKNGMSTYEMGGCLSTEHARADAALNARYRVLSSGLQAKQKLHLRDSQRKWIKDRDGRCREEADEYRGGTMAGLAWRQCMLDETLKRLIWFERY